MRKNNAIEFNGLYKKKNLLKCNYNPKLELFMDGSPPSNIFPRVYATNTDIPGTSRTLVFNFAIERAERAAVVELPSGTVATVLGVID